MYCQLVFTCICTLMITSAWETEYVAFAAGAEDIIKAAQHLEASVAGLEAFLHGEPNAAEKKAIFKALMRADSSLRTPGWTGQGHAFTCPNGHVYFIGECGGATQESRCPECGARIGGRGHSLTAGNRVAVLP